MGNQWRAAIRHEWWTTGEYTWNVPKMPKEASESSVWWAETQKMSNSEGNEIKKGKGLHSEPKWAIGNPETRLETRSGERSHSNVCRCKNERIAHLLSEGWIMQNTRFSWNPEHATDVSAKGIDAWPSEWDEELEMSEEASIVSKSQPTCKLTNNGDPDHLKSKSL